MHADYDVDLPSERDEKLQINQVASSDGFHLMDQVIRPGSTANFMKEIE